MRSKLLIVTLSIIPLFTTAQTAKQILENYFRSIGGIDELRNFKASTSRSLMIQRFGKSDTSVVVKVTKAPKLFHHSIYKHGYLTSETYGNEEGITQLSYKPYFFDQFESTNRGIHISTAHELLVAYEKRKIKRVADTSLNSQDVYAIRARFSSKQFSIARDYYFDKKSTHLIAMSTQGQSNALVTFENYTQHGTLLIPMTTVYFLNGKPLSEFQIQSLQINPDLHDSLFAAKKNLVASIPAFRLSKKIDYLDPMLADADLKTLTEGFRGKVVLVDLWASWCGPCKDEFAKYDDGFHHYLKSKNIEMVYVNFDKADKEETWKMIINQFSLNGYHIRAEKKLKQSIHQKVFDGEQMFIPRLVLVGKNGEVVSTQIPQLSSGFFYTKVDELLNTITP